MTRATKHTTDALLPKRGWHIGYDAGLEQVDGQFVTPVSINAARRFLPARPKTIAMPMTQPRSHPGSGLIDLVSAIDRPLSRVITQQKLGVTGGSGLFLSNSVGVCTLGAAPPMWNAYGFVCLRLQRRLLRTQDFRSC